MSKKASVVVALALSACSEQQVSRVQAPVVYGVDDRLDVYETPAGTLRTVAETAVAAMIETRNLDLSNPQNVRFTSAETLGEQSNLCATERFRDQISPGSCSGTLISNRHILTAGHCISRCDDSESWVLGFHMSDATTVAPLTQDDVYHCQRVIAATTDAGDYAVIELDREVAASHVPAQFASRTETVTVGTGVTLIGHPSGLPMKVCGGATVTYIQPNGNFINAPMDAFGGNSGSGVFNDAGQIVGILVQGQQDYERTPAGCTAVNVLEMPVPGAVPMGDNPFAGVGELMTNAVTAIEGMCTSPGFAHPICGCEGPCVPALPVPEGDVCETATTLELNATTAVNLAAFNGEYTGSCAGRGREQVFTFTVTEAGTLTARTESSNALDTVLYLRSSCMGEELACNDDIVSGSMPFSSLQVALQPGTYFLFADTYGIGDTGTFDLVVTFGDAPPVDTDGGMPMMDAGMPMMDAGMPMMDAGMPMMDAGVEAGDSSIAAIDAGTPALQGDEAASGCSSCSSTGDASPAFALLGLVALIRRRRR